MCIKEQTEYVMIPKIVIIVFHNGGTAAGPYTPIVCSTISFALKNTKLFVPIDQ
jgi:hypothetical protein